MPKRIFSYYPAQITIDGDVVRLRVARLTRTELATLETEMESYGFRHGAGPGDQRVSEVASNEDLAAWLLRVAACIEVEPGDLIVEGSEGPHEVRTGPELLNLYAGREGDVIPMLLWTIVGEQRLSEEQKKAWRSRLDSTSGSVDTAGSATVGPVPAAAPVVTT